MACAGAQTPRSPRGAALPGPPVCATVACVDPDACDGDLGIFSTERFAYEKTLVGLHGSLTPDEMLIPVLVD